MGFTLGVASKVKRLLFSWSIKEKSLECDIVNSGFGSGVADFGNKDETFFDTKVWLDSDCEDDFYSVNGDFTPSRGSTPIRHFGALGTSPKDSKASNVDMFPDNQSEPSPTDKKKLAELLQVSLSEQESSDLNGNIDHTDIVKSHNGIIAKTHIGDVEMNQPQSSFEGTPKPKKERSGLSASCCMPGLLPGVSSRKQKPSPTR